MLIKCPECGREISDKADNCPDCGYPIRFGNDTVYTSNADNQPYGSSYNMTHQSRQYAQNANHCTQKSKNSVLGILALIFSVLGCMFWVGAILALIDLSKNDGRKKTCSTIALVISGLWIFIGVVSGVASNSNSKNVVKVEEVTNEEESGNDVEKEEVIGEADNISEKHQEEKMELSTDKEITFRDIPWGTSFSEVTEILSDMHLMNISGEYFQTKSIDDITLGDYKGLDFEYTDINIIANAMNNEVEVAGYTTNEIDLYFAYIPNNGMLNKTEEESALYGAKYTFSTTNIDEMSDDLRNKLSSTYGAPVKESTDSDIWGNEYEYVFWRGANDTELVLKACDAPDDSELYEDGIEISYVWFEGDKMLQMASDTLKQEAINKEKETYGNGSTNGL